MTTKHVVVEPYSETWPQSFISIRNEIGDALGDLALRIEHVGSTAVPGLSAKPIIDIDVVILDGSVFDEVVHRLGTIGYCHEGNLGIAGREAFKYDGKEHLQKHHLYVCTQDSAELKRHVAFRDYLRSHPEAVQEYSRIKEEGAALYPYDIEKYIGHKSPLIERIYREIGICGRENVRIENDTIRIRDFTEEDLPLMLKWLTDDRVLEYYEGRDVRFTMDTLAAHFLEEIPDGFRVIIEYGDQPVGYAQAYRLSGEMFEEYDYPDQGKVVYAMDQFIGEPDYWNRGIGSAFMQMMAAYLKTSKGAACVLLDPHQNNYRAIRAYEKAGFRIIKALPEHELHEGKMEDCWLMEREL